MGETTPGKFSILHCPTELIEFIILHVKSPSDLLHVALTCRALCQLIIPFHLEFREISCEPISEPVWKYLIANPGKARMVRSLWLLGSNGVKNQVDFLSGIGKKPGPHTWPYSLSVCLLFKDEAIRVDNERHDDEEDEESSTDNERTMAPWEKKRPSWSALCCAVKQMTLLEEFIWNQDDEIPEDIISRLLCALKTCCPHLRRVTGRYTDDYSWSGSILPDELTLNHFGIWVYSPASITHLSMELSLRQTRVRTEVITSALQLIGKSYPNLRSLIIRPKIFDLHPEHLYTLLKNALWPKLESLVWRCDMYAFGEAIFNARPWKDICESFFRCHPLINSLTLSTIPPSTMLLGENTNDLLSNLKSLKVHGRLSKAFDIATLPRSSWRPSSDTPQGLVFLSCSISSSRCIAVLERLPNLRYLIVDFHQGGKDTLKTALDVLGGMPKLERLDIRSFWRLEQPQEINYFIQPKWSPYSKTYPCLTHFIWRIFSTPESIADLMTPVPRYPPNDEHENVPVVSPLASLLTLMPHLQYLLVDREWVRVLQSPGDTGEICISFEYVKAGEVKPSDEWIFLV